MQTQSIGTSYILVVVGCVLLTSGVARAQAAGPTVSDPGPGVPDLLESYWEWELGGLSAGSRYNAKLTISNDCRSAQPTVIFVKNLPELQLDIPGCMSALPDKSCETSVPSGLLEVETVIESPEESSGARMGEIVVVLAEADECPPRRESYVVSFTLQQGDRKKPTHAGLCEAWWNTGQRPSLIKPDEDCTAIIRPRAVRYRERLLAPYVEEAPSEWTWLPSVAQIETATSEEMLTMRLRAALQIAQ